MALLSLSALIQAEKEMPNHYKKLWEFAELFVYNTGSLRKQLLRAFARLWNELYSFRLFSSIGGTTHSVLGRNTQGKPDDT
jgi:hypothetical protein